MIQQTEWKKRREELGLTIKQTADRLHLSEAGYELLEACQFAARPFTVERFDKLFSGDGAASAPWVIDPDMPTMILDAPLKESREIIAQVSTTPNARKIVRAVNNYTQMLTALKRVQTSGYTSDMRDALVLVDAAIATAEGD